MRKIYQYWWTVPMQKIINVNNYVFLVNDDDDDDNNIVTIAIGRWILHHVNFRTDFIAQLLPKN